MIRHTTTQRILLLAGTCFLWLATLNACGTQTACEQDQQCSKGMICFGEVCVIGCRTQSDCTGGLVCLNLQCQQQTCTPGTKSFCYDGPALTEGVFPCRPGTRHCESDGTWSACTGQTLPIAEVCDKEDNDCNGKVDDGIDCSCRPGTKRVCYTGPKETIDIGTCKQGIQYCESNNLWGRCTEQIVPIPEVCDGKDNDCNGQIDDQTSCACTPGDTKPCQQESKDDNGTILCQQGTLTCQPSKQWSSCTITKTFNTQDANEHCGACNNPCPTGTTCKNAICSCPDNKNLCGKSCVDDNSMDHCGACNNKCPTGGQCNNGACECPPSTILCGGACVPSDSINHCGACNNKCSAGAICQNGSCGCPTETIDCDGQCVSIRTNAQHCGYCRRACGGTNPTCHNGICDVAIKAIQSHQPAENKKLIKSEVKAITSDDQGNVYVLGNFKGDLIIDSKTFSSAYNARTKEQSTDIFVLKLTPNGQIGWINRGGGTGEEDAFAIAVGPHGVYITGKNTDESVFGKNGEWKTAFENPGSDTSKGHRGIFVAVLDPSTGAYLSAFGTGGNKYSAGKDIKADKNGNVFLLADFENTISLNKGNSHSSTGSGNDIVLARFSHKSGEYQLTYQWSVAFGSTNYDLGTGLAIDANGNSYITGNIQGKVTSPTVNLTPIGGKDLFLVGFDIKGKVTLQHTFGGINDESGRSIAIGDKQSLYITGHFKGDFPVTPQDKLSATNLDIFLLKYSISNKQLLWGKRLNLDDTTPEPNANPSVFFHPKSEGVYIAGSFRGTLQVEQQTLVSANGTTGFSADAFLARFDTAGHKEMLQPLGEGGDEFAHAFHISPGPTFYLGGSFDSKQLTANQQSVANPEQKTIGFFLQGK